MSSINQLNNQILSLNIKITNIETAFNNTITKKEVKNIINILINQINDLQTRVTDLENEILLLMKH